MNALENFVDTVRCYDGACGAVAAPEPWFVGALAVCLVVLWQGARATSAVGSTGPAAAAGSQLLGRRYGLALTGLLFMAWFFVAFGLSVPALGAVQDPLAWTVMVPLHATLLLSAPALLVGWAAFVRAGLRRPARFRPVSRGHRAALGLAVLALPAGWWLAGAWTPGLVAAPTTAASGWLADALGVGLLGQWVGGLWWLVDLVTSPAALAVVAAAAAGYVLLPHSGEARGAAAASDRRAPVLSSASSRRGSGGVRTRTVPVAPVRVPGGDAGSDGRRGAVVRASTLVLGTVVAVVGGAAAVAGLAAGLGAMPGQGPAVVVVVLAGYVALGLLLRAR